ncbi:hypothetical protein HNP84_004310 [Thermocatellispora tengchongensis]|uniref:Uncharacterized protein n=1 Tax=Thermocatellispora tengchongensis TaxID=1073253 RepID=A0A840P4H6_9ACTN|nr:hypothetical protein [Thermocatellispora tengchongensis]MBB5134578.1 hypothetical protein [Thermocatellispora tengchongensis]
MSRPAPAGLLDRVNALLVAPDAGRGEALSAYVTACAGAAFAAWLAVAAGYPWAAVALVAVIAFDLFGGAVANVIPAVSRRFHRPGRTRRHHAAFVAVHVHPFLIALAVPGFGWGQAAAVYAMTLAAALAVLAAPAHLRRPVAFALTVLACAVCVTVLAIPAALAWFAPILLTKLLLAHLLPERTG